MCEVVNPGAGLCDRGGVLGGCMLTDLQAAPISCLPI